MKKLELFYCIALCALMALLLIWLGTDAEADAVIEPPAVDCSGLKTQEHYEMLYSVEEVVAAATMLHYEYGSSWVDYHEKAKVICTVCNRLKSPRWIAYAGDTFMGQISAPNQYLGYIPNGNYTDYEYRIAYDVLFRDSKIQQGCTDVLWETDCCSFWGDGMKNHFY